jgi:putative thioredoxin
MAGAVDLAAIQARNEAAARAAEAPAPQPGEYVADVTEATFQAEVLDRSFQVPVVIDVRTTRAPASQQLSSSLEQLARESGGAWVLAAIDADANPRVVQALQVRALPTVYAVIGGQLVPGFEGPLPDDQLREFLRAVEQAGREAGLSSVPPPAEGEAEPAREEVDDPRFTAAEDALEAGDYDVAAQRYQSILDAEPANSRAALALGHVRFLRRIETHQADAVTQADADPDDLAAQLAAADLEFAENDVQAAFDRLLRTLQRTAGDDRDATRERLIEYFDLLGPDDPHVAPARREMARVLF